MNDFPPMPSVSRSTQPHRFFERKLNNNLELLSFELQDAYNRIEHGQVEGVTPVSENEAWKDSNSVSTMKWREYNVFQFSSIGLYDLYLAVGDMVKEACEYYNIDFKEQRYMMQGWFNINHANSGKLNWHDHGEGGAPLFHGYYSVSAEPSVTHYLAFNERKENININNRAVLSEMGHPHAMGDWEWEGPRITVAYDIIPLTDLISFGNDYEQHWIPLA